MPCCRMCSSVRLLCEWKFLRWLKRREIKSKNNDVPVSISDKLKNYVAQMRPGRMDLTNILVEKSIDLIIGVKMTSVKVSILFNNPSQNVSYLVNNGNL